ncbi:hypothetical protein C8R46DRAFT_1035537 [Mycena filopes]|nr:hypothetical protein C8R46DRAFT_1035537 [Mycena filopes]
MPPKRKLQDSDPDVNYGAPSLAVPSPKRTRRQQQFFQTSSNPTSPYSSPPPEAESSHLANDEQPIEPLPAFLTQLLERTILAGPSTSSGGLAPPVVLPRSGSVQFKANIC